MPREGLRPRTAQSTNTLNRFFSLQEDQPRISTGTAPTGFDSASGLQLSKHWTSEHLGLAGPSEYRGDGFFKRTYTDMVERVTKRHNTRSSARSGLQERADVSMGNTAGVANPSSQHGLHRTESSASSIHRAGRFFSHLRPRQRRNAVSVASGQTFSQAISRSSEEALRYHWTQLPITGSLQPGSGTAAKAAAQQANAHRQKKLSAKAMQRRADTPEDLMDVDSAYEADDNMSSDSEMGLKLGTCDHIESTFSRLPTFVDPIQHFPAEISLLIFSNLDEKSLRQSALVSKKWHELSENSAVWRHVYLRTHKRRPSNPAPYVQMGGLGLGEVGRPDQEWKKMAKARHLLEKRWAVGKPVAVYFNGHTDSVYCCQFDEEKLITGSRDRTIRIWDMNTFKCLKVIGGPASRPQPPLNDNRLDTVKDLTFADKPSLNGTSTGDAIYHVPSDYHSASILCLQYDHEIMVTGSSDNTCIVWNIKTFEPIQRLNQHSAGVLDVCIDERYIVSCSKDATICVWDRKSLQLIKILEGHRGPVNAVQLRGNLLVSASGDGKSKLWDMDQLCHIRDYESRDRGLAAVEFSDDGRYVLAGGNDQVIYKYDAQTADLLHTFKGHGGLVRSLYLDYANKRVLSGSYDQGIRVYDFNTGEDIAVYDNWTTSWILAAKSDYRRIVATSQDGRALMIDFGRKREKDGNFHEIGDIELLSGKPQTRKFPVQNHQPLLEREDSMSVMDIDRRFRENLQPSARTPEGRQHPLRTSSFPDQPVFH